MYSNASAHRFYVICSEHNQLLPHNTRGERADLERNAQLLSRSVASLCCFHTAKWCLSGLSAPQAQDLITTIFLSLWSSTVSTPTLQHQVVQTADFYGRCCRALWRTQHMMNQCSFQYALKYQPRKLNNNNWYCHLKTLRTLTLRIATLSDQHSGIWFVFSQFFSAAVKKAGIDYVYIIVGVLLHLTLFQRQSWFAIVASCFCASIVVQTGSKADSSKREW